MTSCMLHNGPEYSPSIWDAKNGLPDPRTCEPPLHYQGSNSDNKKEKNESSTVLCRKISSLNQIESCCIEGENKSS